MLLPPLCGGSDIGILWNVDRRIHHSIHTAFGLIEVEELPVSGYEGVFRQPPQSHDDTVTIYEELLQSIWSRIQPTLGRVTVVAIFERAQILTKQSHSHIAHLQVQSEGVQFDVFREQVLGLEADVIHGMLKDFVTNLIDILSMLTGDILVRQLMDETDGGDEA